MNTEISMDLLNHCICLANELFSNNEKGWLNSFQKRNRTVDAAVIRYIEMRYQRLDIILEDFRADHHGVSVGTTLVHKGNRSDVSDSEVALLKVTVKNLLKV